MVGTLDCVDDNQLELLDEEATRLWDHEYSVQLVTWNDGAWSVNLFHTFYVGEPANGGGERREDRSRHRHYLLRSAVGFVYETIGDCGPKEDFGETIHQRRRKDLEVFDS